VAASALPPNDSRAREQGVLLAAFRTVLADRGGSFPPHDEYCWVDMPDPESGRPPELAGLTDEELDALTTPIAPSPTQWPVGIVPPNGFLSPPLTSGGAGFGFGEGEPLDTAAPGVVLAGLAEDTQTALGVVDDDCLIGIIRAWRRLTSWAQARELAAVSELARRRPCEGLPGSGREFTADEVAAALTLTTRAAQGERDLAWQLTNMLPATLAALAEGQIDLPKAKVIADGTAELTPGHAAAVEAAVLPKAPGQTTGQLRAAVAKAVLTADPDAARRQREEAQQRAFVSCWMGPSGTGHLEGHDLPPAQTLAADARISQIAKDWKAQGAQGGMDLLRVHAFMALLLGHDTNTPPVSLLLPGHLPTPAPGTATSGAAPSPGPSQPNDSQDAAQPSTGQVRNSHDGSPASTGQSGTSPAGLRPRSPVAPLPLPPLPLPPLPLPPLAGVINLTVPLTTLLGLAESPGEVTGTGPVDSVTARELAWSTAVHPGTRWNMTVTAPNGTAVATSTARAGPKSRAAPSTGWTVTLTTEPIARGTCDHRHQEPQYRPSPALQRLIRARNKTCCYPGCRWPARRCELDHTIAYDDDGRSCECNIEPLCERHHHLKHTEGWLLTQPAPGVLVWITPAGRRYTTLPSQHPT
jgi:hypothetical protein